MTHGDTGGRGENHEAGPALTSADKRASRIGLILFVPYFLLYAGFMALNVMDPFSMSRRVGPLNIAITYGFLLIGAAFVLAVIYTRLAGAEPGGRR